MKLHVMTGLECMEIDGRGDDDDDDGGDGAGFQ